MEQPNKGATRESTNAILEANLCLSMRRFLAREGYKVHHFTNEDLLRKLKNGFKTSKIVGDGKTFNEAVELRGG